GVAYNRNEAKISLIGVPDRPVVAADLFTKIGAGNIIVDMIIQNVGEKGTNDISFTVSKEELDAAPTLTENIAKELGAKEVQHDRNIAKVSVVGVGMKSHSGVA